MSMINLFEQKAIDSLKYYKGYQGNSGKEDNAIDAEFDRMKSISEQQKSSNQKLVLADLCKVYLSILLIS